MFENVQDKYWCFLLSNYFYYLFWYSYYYINVYNNYITIIVIFMIDSLNQRLVSML